MTWPLGWSYTSGGIKITVDPDGEHRPIGVHGGWFYFNPDLPWWIPYFTYFYAGWRPTPTWSVGFGNEGPWWWVPVSHWMKEHGYGNLGIALRKKK